MQGLQSSLKFAQVRQRAFNCLSINSIIIPISPHQHARMTCNIFKFCRTNLRIEHKSLSKLIRSNCQTYISNQEERSSIWDQHNVNYCKDSLNSITATDNNLWLLYRFISHRLLYRFIQSCICYICVIMYNWLDIAIIL